MTRNETIGVLVCALLSVLLVGSRIELAGANRSFGLLETQTYEKGVAEGVKWALGAFVDGKLLLAPTNFNNTSFSNCIFLRVTRPSAMLELHGTNLMTVQNCSFSDELPVAAMIWHQVAPYGFAARRILFSTDSGASALQRNLDQ